MNRDDTKQKALGLVFLLFLMLTYKQMVFDPYYNSAAKKDESAVSSQAASLSSAAPAQTSSAPTAAQTPAAAEAQAAYPTVDRVKNSGVTRVRTPKYDAEIALLGGRLISLKLNEYAESQEDKDRLELVAHVEQEPYPLGVYNGSIDDSWVTYSLSQASVSPEMDGSYSVQPGKQEVFKLSGSLPDGRRIDKTIRFDGTRYLIEVDVQLSAPNAFRNNLELGWTRLLAPTSESILDPYDRSGYTWHDGKRASRLSFSKFKEKEMPLPGISWVSLADKYFAVALISPSGVTSGRALKTGDLYEERLSGGADAANFLVFAGPKSYQMLRDYGYGLEQNINLGWTGLVSAPLLLILHAVYQPLGNYGLAIIVLTILVKLVLLPLTSTSYRQMKAMQELSPEIKRIKETVTDKQQQQQEMMDLYKKRGVNPLGGCFPILIQLPVFIGLYSALLLAIELRHAPFALWVHDLSAMEEAMVFGYPVPIMAILFVISMVVQQLTTPTPNMDPAQRKMMLVMPVVMGFFFIKAPAGLTLYWLTSNLISVGQNYALRSAKGRLAPLYITVALSAAIFVFAFILTFF